MANSPPSCICSVACLISAGIDESADLGELAAFLTTALIGVAACIRAEAPPDQMHATSSVVASVLDMHRPQVQR